jgi:ATP-dependent exoDNAse (exonuclease V) alpha subunit
MLSKRATPLRQFLADNLAVVELKVIRRQRDPALKRIVELAASGKTGEALTQLAEQRRITEIRGMTPRHEAIALDYRRTHQAGQQTLVVSPGNDERKALNQQIRKLLLDHGQIQSHAHDHVIFVRRDLTRAQLTHARNYESGDILTFTRGSKRRGIGKADRLSVESIDTRSNTVTVRLSDGACMSLNPARWRGVEVFRLEARTLAVGDRIQFRAPQRDLKIANGEFATILQLASQHVTLRMNDRREVSASWPQLRHIDYGYASTSHAAQGATVDRVIVNIDTTRSAQLVNARQFYVSISRARYDAHVYTNDEEALRRSVGRDPNKANALEVVRKRPTTKLTPTQTVELRPSATTELQTPTPLIQPSPPSPAMRISR